MEAGKKREIPKKLLLCLLFGGVLVMCLEMGLSILRPGAPGSLARHAALWAGCFGILAAGTLLVNYWQPAAKAWARLNEKLMDPETRKPWISVVLGIAAGAMLLHHFYVVLYYPYPMPAGAAKFAPVWIVLAAVTAVLGRAWRDPGTRIGTLLLVFMFERTFIAHLGLTGSETVLFATGIYAVYIAYGVFSAFSSRAGIRFLKILCPFWAAGTLALCGMGLYTGWTGVEIHNLGWGYTRVLLGRLWVFSNPTISGGWLSSFAAVLLVGFALSRKSAARAAYLVIVFLAALTISLTDSRSSYMMMGFLIAGMVCLSLHGKWSERAGRSSGAKPALMILSLALCFVLCFAAVVEGEHLLSRAFTGVRDRGGLIVSAARAEETAPAASPLSIIQRETWLTNEADADRLLNGRLSIWRDILKYVRENPRTLLYGLSADGSVLTAVGRDDHVHNILLQLLMEDGIPAVLLFLGLLLYFFIHACRLWKRWELPLWQRMLPVPALAILLQEMAECLTHFSYGHPPMTVLYFFMGCTVAVSRRILAEEAGKTAGNGIPRGVTGG